MDESRKRVIGIMAAILAARDLPRSPHAASYDTFRTWFCG
jgi:hypothetical protein